MDVKMESEKMITGICSLHRGKHQMGVKWVSDACITAGSAFDTVPARHTASLTTLARAHMASMVEVGYFDITKPLHVYPSLRCGSYHIGECGKQSAFKKID